MGPNNVERNSRHHENGCLYRPIIRNIKMSGNIGTWIQNLDRLCSASVQQCEKTAPCKGSQIRLLFARKAKCRASAIRNISENRRVSLRYGSS